MAVRNKIKEFCSNRAITPYRLWKDAGLAPKTAYDLYNNPSQLPSSSVLSKICDTYEVQPSELLEWVKENSNN
ncbi:MAG: helix-turn-helix domain-containing protein [Planktothrix sp.]|uniref:helix-turn-helix domain-containing protein n=1 Tax=Planktothrix sp. TaxID=3088171 RepID=UPI0038D3B7C6